MEIERLEVSEIEEPALLPESPNLQSSASAYKSGHAGPDPWPVQDAESRVSTSLIACKSRIFSSISVSFAEARSVTRAQVLALLEARIERSSLISSNVNPRRWERLMNFSRRKVSCPYLRQPRFARSWLTDEPGSLVVPDRFHTDPDVLSKLANRAFVVCRHLKIPSGLDSVPQYGVILSSMTAKAMCSSCGTAARRVECETVLRLRRGPTTVTREPVVVLLGARVRTRLFFGGSLVHHPGSEGHGVSEIERPPKGSFVTASSTRSPTWRLTVQEFSKRSPSHVARD